MGLFVLGALVLIAAGIAAMSARRLFAEYRTYVVFFPYAVGGLRAGAPVTFRQVQVGHVTEVDLVFKGETFGDSWIMAVIEIRRNALRDPSGKAADQSDAELARIMIESGLRASVRSSSMIAGQRSVDLDLRPETAARLSGIRSRYPEIPSAPTGMEVINERVEATLKKISDVPIDEVLLQLDTTLESLQKALDERRRPRRRCAGCGRRSTARRGRFASAEKAMGQVDGVSGQATATLASIDQTMKGLQKTLDRLDKTLATVERNVEGTAELRSETLKTVEEMNELMKSLRSLVEMLQQHPESLLRGKERAEALRARVAVVAGLALVSAGCVLKHSAARAPVRAAGGGRGRRPPAHRRRAAGRAGSAAGLGPGLDGPSRDHGAHGKGRDRARPAGALGRADHARHPARGHREPGRAAPGTSPRRGAVPA